MGPPRDWYPPDPDLVKVSPVELSIVMALVGTRVQVAQDGNTTLAVKTDLVIDERTGLMAERKTVVAEVLTQSGNHKAVIAGDQIRLASVTPPEYSPRSDYAPNLPYVRDDSKEGHLSPLTYCTICISCILLLAMAVVFIVAPAAGGTLSCIPLMPVGAINITIGACTLLTALCYFVYLCARVDNTSISKGIHRICCLLASLMFLAFLAMAIAESVLVAENESYVDDGKCKNSAIPLTLTILSWVIWLLICCCGCFSCYKCFKVAKTLE